MFVQKAYTHSHTSSYEHTKLLLYTHPCTHIHAIRISALSLCAIQVFKFSAHRFVYHLHGPMKMGITNFVYKQTKKWQQRICSMHPVYCTLLCVSFFSSLSTSFVRSLTPNFLREHEQKCCYLRFLIPSVWISVCFSYPSTTYFHSFSYINACIFLVDVFGCRCCPYLFSFRLLLFSSSVLLASISVVVHFFATVHFIFVRGSILKLYKRHTDTQMAYEMRATH